MNFLEGKNVVFLSQKGDKNMIFTDYGKVLALIFSGMGDTAFLSQKVDGKMLFTDFGNVLVLNFSVIGKTVFFWVEKLMERWYLLTNEKFLFWILRRWEIRSFLSQKVDEKIIYILGLFEISMIFRDLGNMVFRTVLSA